ncbi:hypothetical protein GCM10009111_15280 [Colwellia asteriadis]|uniref:cysteine desulfurase n=1 Tax=Colwellia asteriadis TaxID=517723 RepID=A0ABP3WFE3_9GAMM
MIMPNNTQPFSLVYLDANATTQVLPQAAAAALTAMETQFGNPSSSHISGLQAKKMMDKTRQQAKAVIGADEGSVIFTSGATEGIQTAILSALLAVKKSRATRINDAKSYSLLYGATEHKAVAESLKHWNDILDIGATVKAIPVNSSGQLDLSFIAKEVPNALMVCTMAVNNETGVYQDIALLDKTIREHNPQVAWMVDCVQALGKTPLNLASTSIDYAPFSGHKLYAPKGIGFLYVKEHAPFTPVIAGGGQESGLRSGTENLPGLAALSVIFDMLLAVDHQTNAQKSALVEEQERSKTPFAPIETLHLYRQQLASALQKAFPTIVFNHRFDNSVATTLNFAIPGFSSKEIMDLFDAANVRVSSGSACSSKVTRSFVLDAMGLPAWQSESAIRMSFGPAMTPADIDIACERILLIAQTLANSCLTPDSKVAISTAVNSHDGNRDKAKINGLVQYKVGGSCTWLYIDNKAKLAFIIDPLAQVTNRLSTMLSCQGLHLAAVIDTHGHADHQSCRTDIAKACLSTQQSDELGWPLNAHSVIFGEQEYQYITIGDKWLLRVVTPGHTNDSISLLLCDPVTKSSTHLTVYYAFCGDLILMGSLGRTNFDNSSALAMYESLQHIQSLIGVNSLICPSHDYHHEFTTSIAGEVSRNTLLAQVMNNEISKDEFSRIKANLDKTIIDETGHEIMCGALSIKPCTNTSINNEHSVAATKQKTVIEQYNSDSLAKAIKQKELLLIDIRESHEYALQHDAQFTYNVPLTRLVQFIKEHSYDKSRPLVLICRSGSRSLLAAQALVRLGFNNVGNMQGGYAHHRY